MKKILGMFLAVFSVFGLVSCLEKEAKAEGESYVSLDINPSIELIVSSDDEVLEVYATNDDAKAMLYGEVEIKGMDFEEAIDKITDLSIEYGYLTEENSVIEYSISSTDNEELKEALEAKINAKIKDKALEFKFDISLSKEGVFSLIREFEKVKKENPNNADIQKLSIEEFKLIKSAQSSDEKLTVEEAVELDTKELMERIRNSRDEAYNIATKKYDRLVSESKIVYEKALKSFERSVYASYYMKNVINHPVNYGLLYSLYGTAADTLQAMVDLSNKVDSYAKQVLTEDELAVIAEAVNKLGVAKEEFFNEIKDEEGNITLDSINAYLDKLVKNLEDNEDIKAIVEELKTSMSDVDAKVEEKLEKLGEKYNAEIEALVKTFEATYKQISSLGALMPAELKAVLDTYLAELQEMNNMFKEALTEQITLTKINEWITELREKEAEMLNKINEDLTEEELAEIEELKTKLDSNVKDLEKKMHDAKEDAKNKMNDHLNQLKPQKKGNK